MEQMGQAYGFFKCNASVEEIQEYMPTIRELAQTPSELELSLIEERDFNKDKTLNYIIKSFNVFGVNYTLKAKCPNVTNEKTATKLLDIFNNIYSSSHLYKKGEKFFGDICFKNKGRYEFRD